MIILFTLFFAGLLVSVAPVLLSLYWKDAVLLALAISSDTSFSPLKIKNNEDEYIYEFYIYIEAFQRVGYFDSKNKIFFCAIYMVVLL